MLDAPALPPPALVAPAPREASFGLVAGTAPAGTVRVLVRVGERVLADRPLRGTRFSLRVVLPRREVSLRVTTEDRAGRRASTVVPRVFGLPRAPMRTATVTREDPVLAASVRALARGFGGTSAVYVEDLATGRGAAWNARARFPAASTLKLAIAATVLAAHPSKPAAGSAVDVLLRRMVVRSDNEAANELQVWLGGSTAAGSARVNALLTALGLTDSDMYGGYETERALQAPIPVRVESQPRFGVGKYSSAWDLARLARAVHLAAGGRGPLLRLGVTGAEARYLLRLLALVSDRGRLDRFLGGRAAILHKAGWLERARHDNGLVYFDGGAFVATVLTWQAGGVGGSADVLAGRVAAAAYDRFRSVG